MSKITIETRIVPGTGKLYGWAYRISKGRRQYQSSGVFQDLMSPVEAEIVVFNIMCTYLHENIKFEDDTKITIVSECREVIRMMRYGRISEIGEIKSGNASSALDRLLKFRETEAKCVYRFISSDKKELLDHGLTLLAEKALKDD